MTDFINLTNGLNCCQVEDPHYLRIQSTWCEQKRWDDVLATVGPDFLYHLATGSRITVHDVSERPRVTRACWQGLAFIKFACERIWDAPHGKALVRNDIDSTKYFESELAQVSLRTIGQVKYFRKFYAGQPLSHEVCDAWRLEKAA